VLTLEGLGAGFAAAGRGEVVGAGVAGFWAGALGLGVAATDVVAG
jgi:hypothetical protein